ncbi:ALDH3A2 (predicted) [Pycnogonum litorale]
MNFSENHSSIACSEMDASYECFVHRLRSVFKSGKTSSIKFRIKQLNLLHEMLVREEDTIVDALKDDLRKPKYESVLYEIDIVRQEIKYALNNIKQWTKPQPIPKLIPFSSENSYTQSEPYGVVLIIGAWNCPVHTTLMPLVGAIAAGNVVVIKVCRQAAMTAKIIAEKIRKYLDNDCFKVVEANGEPLLKERFDLIFFTGGTKVGRLVHEAANKHLTPVILEMGGKNPTYIDSSSKIEVAVKRILWGKFINLGQTCTSPDYILCNDATFDKFLKAVKKVMTQFYGEDNSKSKDLGRIINERHFNRLSAVLDVGKVAVGGVVDAEDLYISPTVLVDVVGSDDIMQEEIFGPILPVIRVKNEDEAIDFINRREKTLALYVMSTSEKVMSKFINRTSSGAIVFNDTHVQLINPRVPFGGIGMSGNGKYHGKFSFDAFSHLKSVIIRRYGMLEESYVGKSRYPPYSNSGINKMKSILKNRNISQRGCGIKFFVSVLIVLIILLVAVVVIFATNSECAVIFDVAASFLSL